VESLETANKEQSIKVVLLDQVGNQLHTGLARELSVCANLGTTLAGPAINLEPVEWTNGTKRLIIVVSSKSSETVVDGKRLVAL
jgi:hypothetical protein